MPVKIMARACAAALLLACAGAHASTIVNVAITLPTEYDDGAVLPAEAIKDVVLEWRRNSGPNATPVEGSVTLQPYTKSYGVALSCGTYIFDAYAVTDEGQTGQTAWSAPFDTGIACPL